MFNCKLIVMPLVVITLAGCLPVKEAQFDETADETPIEFTKRAVREVSIGSDKIFNLLFHNTEDGEGYTKFSTHIFPVKGGTHGVAKSLANYCLGSEGMKLYLFGGNYHTTEERLRGPLGVVTIKIDGKKHYFFEEQLPPYQKVWDTYHAACSHADDDNKLIFWSRVHDTGYRNKGHKTPRVSVVMVEPKGKGNNDSFISEAQKYGYLTPQQSPRSQCVHSGNAPFASCNSKRKW